MSLEGRLCWLTLMACAPLSHAAPKTAFYVPEVPPGGRDDEGHTSPQPWESLSVRPPGLSSHSPCSCVRFGGGRLLDAGVARGKPEQAQPPEIASLFPGDRSSWVFPEETSPDLTLPGVGHRERWPGCPALPQTSNPSNPWRQVNGGS